MQDNKNVLTAKISFFHGIDANPEDVVTVEQALEAIKNDPKLKEAVERIRATSDKGERDKLKKQLKAVTWSGTFAPRRANNCLVQHSGLLCLDFDNVPDPNALKSLAAQMPFVLAAFISPSGNGVKVLCRIDGTRHRESFEALRFYFLLHRYQCDDTPDVARLCYLSFDPELYLNANAVLLELGERRDETQSNDPQSKAATLDEVESALAAIAFPLPYLDWLKIGFAIASEFGADKAAELMFKYAPPTQPGETIKDYRRKFAAADGRVTLGTLFKIAREHGWETFREKERAVLNATGEILKKYSPRPEDYPLTSLPRTGGKAQPKGREDDEPIEPSALESLATHREFSEHLIPPIGLFQDLYRYFTENEIPAPFAFACTVQTVSAVIGNRVFLRFSGKHVMPNDFMILVGRSGVGKSTSLELVNALLFECEKRIVKDAFENLFLLPHSVTERGLIDVMRTETQAEKEKGKVKKSQSSGLWVIDEISSLFASCFAQHNSGLYTLILRLWGGAPITLMTSLKNDGKMNVPETSIAILGATTFELLKEKLPRSAWSDGLLGRICFIEVETTKPQRRTILELADVLPDEPKELVDCLIGLFQFSAKHGGRVKDISADAKKELRKFEAAWGDARAKVDNKVVLLFSERLQTRAVKYGLIYATLRSFHSGETITLDREAIKWGGAVATWLWANQAYFVLRHESKEDKIADNIGKYKQKVLQLLNEREKGEERKKILKDYTHLSKETFDKVLNELIADGKVRIEKRLNKNGREVEYVVRNTPQYIPPLASLASLASLQEKNETETKPKLGSEASESASLRSEANESMPAMPAPEPLQPEPKPVPAPEPAPEMKPQPTTEPPPLPPCFADEPPPASAPEAFRENPVETLRKMFAGKVFSGAELREAIAKVAKDEIEFESLRRLLWRTRTVLRIEQSDRFIWESARPKEFEGYLPNERGEIPESDVF